MDIEQSRLDQALEWHFLYNHYPHLSLELLPVAKLAIESAKAGEWDKTISLEGTRFNMTTREIIKAWHLEDFIQPDQEGG